MPTKPTTKPLTATFSETLLHALERFPDPVALGRTSPLAKPYLLGTHLTPADDDERARGRVLQRLLRMAADAMTGADADLYRAIIEERYFKGQSAAAVYQGERVPLGKTQYFAHQKRAVAQLEPHLLDLLNPTLRLEQPVIQAGELIDRDRAAARSLAALKQKQTVLLTGSGGVGKTSLGSRLAQAWGSAVLWFTVRPGLNDHLAGFLFELAYFCRLRGAAWLWQELIANNGYLPASRIPAIVRGTLAHLSTLPLLAIDEADLLLVPISSDGDGDGDAVGAAEQPGPTLSLIQLLAALRGTVPILVMGQRSALEADHYETLTGLSAPLTNVLLKTHRVLLDEPTQRQLYQYTDGNPRLLHLLIALYQSGEALDALFVEFGRSPSLRALLGRMLQRLSDLEIGLLMDLSVFQDPAPMDVWQQRSELAAALQTLHARHLLQLDQQGGVALLPAYRDIIAATLSVDKAQQLHERAAAIYAQRGRYTPAVYHLSYTAAPERAIGLWRTVQQQEINRGQAYPALRIFQRLAGQPLSAKAHEQIALFCSSLQRHLGDSGAAARDLRAILFKTPLLQLEADELLGTIANDQGELPRAEADFRRALEAGEQLVSVRLAHAYKGLGWRYRNERLLAQAWHHGVLAQYEVANFQGEVHYMMCRYRAAIAQFETALGLAKELGHADGIAKTSNNLGRIHTTIGEIDAAKGYFAEAEAIYRRIGKVPAMDGMQINRAFLCNLTGAHAEAVTTLQRFLAEKAAAREALSPLMTALLQQNLAEAYLGLRELENAEAAVQQSIAQEEIHVLPDALRTHGEIKLQQGLPLEAERLIRHALDLIAQMETPDAYLAGYAWRALVQVYLVLGDEESVRQAYQTAMDCFVAINLPNEVERTERLYLSLP